MAIDKSTSYGKSSTNYSLGLKNTTLSLKRLNYDRIFVTLLLGDQGLHTFFAILDQSISPGPLFLLVMLQPLRKIVSSPQAHCSVL